MKKKIISALLLLVMTMSVITTPAMATNTSFTDVPADSVYAESIETMYRLGVVGGVGNNQFAPDRAVTYTELRIMLARLYKNGDTSTVQFPAQYENIIQNSAVTWQAGTEIALNVSGTQCYSYTVFDNPAYQNDAMNAAVVMGVYGTSKPSSSATMTRAECVYFLYMLKNCTTAPTPESLARFSKITIEDGDATYTLRNMVATEVKIVPDFFIDLFNSGDFTLILSNSISKYSDKKYDDNITLEGKTTSNSTGKRMVLFPAADEYTALYHELGHVVAITQELKKTTFLTDVWKYDAAGAKELTGWYSQTNPDECWAEAFEYLMTYQNDSEKMALAKKKMPVSYAYFNTLVEFGQEYEKNKAS